MKANVYNKAREAILKFRDEEGQYYEEELDEKQLIVQVAAIGQAYSYFIVIYGNDTWMIELDKFTRDEEMRVFKESYESVFE